MSMLTKTVDGLRDLLRKWLGVSQNQQAIEQFGEAFDRSVKHQAEVTAVVGQIVRAANGKAQPEPEREATP